MGTSSAVRGRLPELLAALFGLGWFLALGGGATLSPAAFGWLEGDQRGQLMGWLFFRESGWSLPLGRIDGLAWPIGTTVGFTDGNPLIAVPLKLFSPLLPARFQFIGAWLAACFALQGWFGARVAATASASGAFRFLGGCLFALSPVLVARLGHTTLCAHFAILALLELHLRAVATESDARRALRAALVVACLVGAVHPVLAAMILALAFALVARFRRQGLLARRAAWGWAGKLLLGEALVWLVLGYFTSAPSHGWGFGIFSADLLTLVNPAGYSRLFPALPMQGGQYEGIGYLGLGVFALLVAGASAAAVARRRSDGTDDGGAGPQGWPRATLPVAAACAAMFVFALSSKVTIAGRPLVDVSLLYKPIYPLVGPFRSSGRFVWPLHYLLFAAALWFAARSLRPRAATAAVAAAVALQLFDVSAVGKRFGAHAWTLDAPEWQLAKDHYDHLALYPAQVVGAGNDCSGQVYLPDFHHSEPYALLAYELGMTVNSGFLSRASARKHEPVCRALLAGVRAGEVDERTLYVVHPSALEDFRRAGAVCGRVEERDVCVTAKGPANPFRERLRGARDDPPGP